MYIQQEVKVLNLSLPHSFPLSGDYRPLRPKYGDYQYLPPQRWLGALKVWYPI